MVLTDDASFTDTPTQGQDGSIATQDLFYRRDAAPWSSTAFSQDPSDRITTQDLFSRLPSSPESPTAPSLHRANERAALPAETSPCTALHTKKQQASLLLCWGCDAAARASVGECWGCVAAARAIASPRRRQPASFLATNLVASTNIIP